MLAEAQISLGKRLAEHAAPATTMLREELHHALQVALELEHATIPAYSYALYSLRPGTNNEAAQIIQSIVTEEMLHMALVCNILNAVGGRPSLDHPGFVPEYPCQLPLGPSGQLLVPLKRCSRQLIRRVCMVIEQPTKPGHEHEHTLAAFYERIERSIVALGESIFTGDAALQVRGPIGREKLQAITNVETACHALNEIIDQGEGSRHGDPFVDLPPDEGGDELAHYYRFAELYHGQRLVMKNQQITYTGAPVPFDRKGVWPAEANPKAASLPAGSAARLRADAFNQAYSDLLRVLHAVFNGHPEWLNRAVGMMFAVQLQAQALMATPLPDEGGGRRRVHAGPSFEYMRAITDDITQAERAVGAES